MSHESRKAMRKAEQNQKSLRKELELDRYLRVDEDPFPSKRVFKLLKNVDLEGVTFDNVQNAGNPMYIEKLNRQELFDLCLVNFARLCVVQEWDGLLTGGGGGGAAANWGVPWVSGKGVYWEAARSAPYGTNKSQTAAPGTDMLLWPFYAPQDGDVSLMAVRINSPTSQEIQMCIYGTVDGLPSNLLGYGVFDCDQSPATITQDSFSSTITLEQGVLYWYGPKSTTSTTCNMKGINADYLPTLGPINTATLGNDGSGTTCVNTEVLYGDSLPATLTPGDFTYLNAASRMALGLEFA